MMPTVLQTAERRLRTSTESSEVIEHAGYCLPNRAGVVVKQNRIRSRRQHISTTSTIALISTSAGCSVTDSQHLRRDMVEIMVACVFFDTRTKPRAKKAGDPRPIPCLPCFGSSVEKPIPRMTLPHPNESTEREGKDEDRRFTTPGSGVGTAIPHQGPTLRGHEAESSPQIRPPHALTNRPARMKYGGSVRQQRRCQLSFVRSPYLIPSLSGRSRSLGSVVLEGAARGFLGEHSRFAIGHQVLLISTT